MATSTFQQWLKASKGDFPRKGVANVDSRWFSIGTLNHTGKSLAVTHLVFAIRAGGRTVGLESRIP